MSDARTPGRAPGGPAGPGGGSPKGKQHPASLARFKRELRRETKRKAIQPQINFLNITAMLDMMTIILVFLLKSMSTSTRSIPRSADLELPKSVLALDPKHEPQGVMVVVSKTKISVGDSDVCAVPDDARQYGLETRHKRGSRNDFFIVPLGQKLQAWRDADKQIRAATGRPLASEAVVVVDKETPYRVLSEVLVTLGETEFSKYHMMVLQTAK